MADKALLDGLMASISDTVSFAFTGVSGAAAVDCGQGRCAVGILIETALSDGDMTFDGSPLQQSTEPTVVSIRKEGQATSAAYTFGHGAATAFFPLDPVVFHSLRWIKLTSSVSQTGKTVKIVTDVV